ncbi:OmpP1/FadL family transporter [Desulfoluna butyratoxydans]|uniref:Outer membrane protein transport protein (Ompp1/fadl/todx) n=1 Tax=Desulfoluna butyratoxydans TaxID=231438 RepID=A0A4U8YMV4_9BACT|nr:outer membrane protein transport protein [Desulfoluna butyratoxydans]VFQ45071.1 outer membrane protein transport protein (ompp1/fadl/todx) [Desulfoluna butyratoxydans]
MDVFRHSKKRPSPRTDSRPDHAWRCAAWMACALLVLWGSPPLSRAAFNEQVATDALALSLANTVTADPPGIMSIHYNPAGLSLLPEGKTFGNSLVLARIERTGRFNADPDWPGLMSGQWGPDPEKWPDTYSKETDPNSDHAGPDPLDGTEGTNSANQMYIPFVGPVEVPVMPSPNLGIASRKKNSPLTFGIANYVPYGAGFVHGDEDDPYRYSAKSVYTQHLVYAAPAASLRLSDTLSVGVSVGFAQRAMGVEVDLRTPNELVAMTRVIGDATKDLEIPVVSEQTLPPPWLGGGLGPYEHVLSLQLDELRDDFVPSFNLGLLWRPKDWFSFGICYQSESVAELTGEYTWTYSDQFQRHVEWNGKTEMTMQSAGMLDLPFIPVETQTGTVTATQTLPMRVQTGIMVKPFDRLKILADLHWANWSVVEEDRFTFDQRIQILRIAKLLGYAHGDNDYVVERDMKDTWHWSAAIEYQATDNLAFRLGYERRPTSLNQDQMDALYFLPDATLYGAGVGLKLDKGIKLNLTLGLLLSDELKLANNESTNLNSTDFTKIGNHYAGLHYEQEAAIYMAGFSIEMPLEVQMELLHHQLETVKHLVGKLNPFKKDKKETHEEVEIPSHDIH